MIRQIHFLKGELVWVNFPAGTIKPGVVNGNEVINVLSCQTEEFSDGTRTSLHGDLTQQLNEYAAGASTHTNARISPSTRLGIFMELFWCPASQRKVFGKDNVFTFLI